MSHVSDDDNLREVEELIAFDGLSFLFLHAQAHKIPSAIAALRKKGHEKKAALLVEQVVTRFGSPIQKYFKTPEEAIESAQLLEGFGTDNTEWLNEIGSKYLKMKG